MQSLTEAGGEQTPEVISPVEQPTEDKGTPPQPEPLTREAVQEIVGAAITQAIQRANQSSRDRDRNIQTAVQALETRLADLNVPVTAEMRTKMTEQVAQEIDSQTQAPAQPVPASDLSRQVYNETQEIFTEEGIAVAESDPEWKFIKAALEDRNGSFVKYRREVYKAVEAKRDRLAEHDETAAARVGGGEQPSNGKAQPATARQAWQNAYKK